MWGCFIVLDIFQLSLFIGSTIVLLITPGPSVLYIVARSIDQGRAAGLVSVAGVQTASLLHTIAGACGISALLMASATVFTIVKYLGAVYLIYLGVRKLLSREQFQPSETINPKKLTSIFYEGVVVNLLNPKTALFFLAFFPQFINPSNGSVALQFIVLGLMFTLMALISDSLYALLASSFRHWFTNNPFALKSQHYVTGGLYIFLGAATAMLDSNKK